MISGKAAEYKLFYIRNEKSLGGVKILLSRNGQIKKWVNKVVDISRVRENDYY